MERVAFLTEDTGERIPCLLNPETLVVRRTAGVRRAGSAGGTLTGADLGDDPLVVTGGGRTELELDLLFDTSLLPAPAATDGRLPAAGDPLPEPPATDVRDLTRPLWRLAENVPSTGGFGAPPLVRFVWGKAWNVLGVVASVAERVEQFTADGSPQRSWLRIRLVRVSEPGPPPEVPPASPAAIAAATGPTGPMEGAPAIPGGAGPVPAAASTYEVVGDERTDQVADKLYPGRPWMWRFVAGSNGIENPPFIPPGTILQAPPAPPMPEPESEEGAP